MRVILRKEKPDRTVLDVIDIETWENFEHIAELVINQFGGKSIKQIDGPDGSRRWFIRIGPSVLLFDLLDMVGMQIAGEGDSAGELVARIEPYLERSERPTEQDVDFER